MENKQVIRTSKFLSLVLRHQPSKIGITLDEQGWVEVEELLEKMKNKGVSISRAQLEYVVANNNKSRFAFDESGQRIRASQGHSVKIELGYKPLPPPEILFHGTAEKNLASIRGKGLVKGRRHHVHLSDNLETATQVGSRHGKPVVLPVKSGEMEKNGFAFFQSENGVWLTEHVPPEYILAGK